MENILISDLLNKLNIHLDLPSPILELSIANPFELTDEYIVSFEEGKTIISFGIVRYEFDINNPNAILTMENEYRHYSFNEDGVISILTN